MFIYCRTETVNSQYSDPFFFLEGLLHLILKVLIFHLRIMGRTFQKHFQYLLFLFHRLKLTDDDKDPTPESNPLRFSGINPPKPMKYIETQLPFFLSKVTIKHLT